MTDKISLRRVEELAAHLAHEYPHTQGKADTAAALEALVRLVEAAREARRLEDVQEHGLIVQALDAKHAFEAALAEFEDDRETK